MIKQTNNTNLLFWRLFYISKSCIFFSFQSCSEVKQEEEKASSPRTRITNISNQVFRNPQSVSATLSAMFVTKLCTRTAAGHGQGEGTNLQIFEYTCYELCFFPLIWNSRNDNFKMDKIFNCSCKIKRLGWLRVKFNFKE